MDWLPFVLLPFATAAAALGIALTVYALALYQLWFTFVREGTAMFVMKGETFDCVFMVWNGHYLNDPRRHWFDLSQPEWEVLPIPAGRTKDDYRIHRFWLNPLTWLEQYGIYYYGFYPFKDIHVYEFKWAEERVTPEGSYEPWYRDEPTQIVFVNQFVYWVKLVDAEDTDNIPVSLDYLLTVEVNNPRKARFDSTDWFERLTADTNNAARRWVSRRKFEEVVKEHGGHREGNDTFVNAILSLNTSLQTERHTGDQTEIRTIPGAPESIGVRLISAALYQVSVGGRNQAAIMDALTAKEISAQKAKAVIAEAEGDKKAMVLRAEGERDAAKLVARGRKSAIKTVYTEVQKHGELGLMLSQLDALQNASGAGARIIWANNPFLFPKGSGLAAELERNGVTPQMLADGLRRLASEPNSSPPTG